MSAFSAHTFYATRRALRSLSCSLMDPGGRGAARHGPAADGMDLADEPCAAAATQENDFAMMKVGQLRAMTDADDGRVSELLRQQLHHSILAPGIESRSSFVEHDDIRAIEQDSRKRQPLFLSTRQDLIPRLVLIEAPNEVV